MKKNKYTVKMRYESLSPMEINSSIHIIEVVYTNIYKKKTNYKSISFQFITFFFLHLIRKKAKHDIEKLRIN